MWELLERIVKIVGILGGLAAVVGVWVQLRDLNSREQQREIAGWQSAIVYEIIEKGKTLTLDQISDKYINEAEKANITIPKEELRDLQLRIVLESLMDKNVIFQKNGDQYSVVYQERGLYGSEYQNLVARQIRLARGVLTDAKTPLSYEQLRARMIEEGADKQFLKDNYDYFLQVLQSYGIAWVQDDGKVALMLTPVPSPPSQKSEK